MHIAAMRTVAITSKRYFNTFLQHFGLSRFVSSMRTSISSSEFESLSSPTSSTPFDILMGWKIVYTLLHISSHHPIQRRVLPIISLLPKLEFVHRRSISFQKKRNHLTAFAHTFSMSAYTECIILVTHSFGYPNQCFKFMLRGYKKVVIHY